MAETLKTSFSPWRYILIVAALFVVAGLITGADNIPGLILDLVAVMAVVALIWFVANLIERRNEVARIDAEMQAIADRLNAQHPPMTAQARTSSWNRIDKLKAERATLTGWLVK